MSYTRQFKRVIVLAPHTDDGEFGCGASIAKFIEDGSEVFYVAFSIAEESVPKPFPKNILEVEVRNATEILGIDSNHLILHKYRVRNFASERQSILEILVQLNKEVSPDLVFMPSINDLHQDHSTIAIEGLRAFKKTTILCYELPWNNIVFSNNCFISFGENHLDLKIQALKCYISQMQRNYASEEFVRGLAITRGTQIGTRFAEVFEVVRWVMN
ncbi:MAG TPA: PIG-L family deacetylase [Candidatus Syntrophosphaera sp.]|nr:PIG-L family deacetylase [Candidatus Cloacimonadota bacterium]HOR02695.1 PIG-L family deacetylase [Candidatus Syntrophosphaera sp.]